VQGQSQVPTLSVPVAPLHTPPVKPAAEPLDSSAPKETAIPVLTPQIFQHPEHVTVPATSAPVPPTSQPDFYPQPTPPQDSLETKAPVRVSMGTVGSTTLEDLDGFERFLSIEAGELISPGEDQVGVSATEALVAVEEVPQVDIAEVKRVGRHQILTDQTMDWIKTRDYHKFWRRFLAGSCNKNLSYNTWPPEFQAAFDERFNAMVNDPCFVSTLCGRIIRMQNGHLVACHVAGAFVVATAGFLSFSLLEV
ncbi:hypothetical protein LCGC14_2402500, partial [marine sediment metagenome]